METFTNKVAVITGAASGIGAGLAAECARRKMKMVLADINNKQLLETEKELKKINNNIVSIVVNVASKDNIKKQAQSLKNSIKAGISAQEVAKQVFAAINKNQFYILTYYNEHSVLIKNRVDNLLALNNPALKTDF